MSDIKDFKPVVRHKWEGLTDPVTVTGAKVKDEYRNTVSKELFTMVSDGPQVWVGSQGAGAGITGFNHPDLLAAYPMVTSGSTLIDASPNGNDGTITGAVQVAGKIDNALYFGAGGHTVNVPSLGTFPVTYAFVFWVNPDSAAVTGPDSAVYEAWRQSKYLHDSSTSSSRDSSQFYAIGWSNNAGDLLTASTWTMVTVEYDGSNLRTYYNTVLQRDNTAGTPSPSGTALKLGNNGADNSFIGKLDLFRVFNRALTATERAELYNGGLGA